MDPQVLVKGILLGFSIAAPVGPIGVLCIRRSLGEGRLAGFLSGLGAASADAVYGAIAALGLTAISGALLDAKFWLALLGGLFLLYLGARTLLAKPEPRMHEDVREESPAIGRRGLSAAFFSTLGLTLTNPMTILAFTAMFAGLGPSGAPGSLVLGVFLGSAAWWWLLSALADRFRSRLGGTGLLWVNRLSGCLIAGFGLMALHGALFN
jgi:threonine/homoserine/homoserine lactone efflux protein